MTIRASLEQTLEFCNTVREAGGTNALDALMPAVPQESDACLIAANLNFNCRVDGNGRGQWYMIIDPGYDGADVDAIADATGCEVFSGEVVSCGETYEIAIALPDSIGQVARDFDDAWSELEMVADAWEGYKVHQENVEDGWEPDYEYEDFRDYLESEYREPNYKLIEDFWPYIEASVKETRTLGFINEKGKLVL